MEHTMMTTHEFWRALAPIAIILAIGFLPYGLYYTFVKKKHEYSWRLKILGVCVAFFLFFMGLSPTVRLYKQEYLSMIPWFTDKNPEYVFHIFVSIVVYGMWGLSNCVCIMGMLWADELEVVNKWQGKKEKEIRKDFFQGLFWLNSLGLIVKFVCKV